MEVEEGAADTTLEGQNIEEGNTKDQEIEPVQLIPNGFVVDDSLPSISLEDFSEENDVWLVDVPVAVDPQKLIGHQLEFRQEASFIIDELSNEKCVSLPSDGPCSAVCLLSSNHDHSRKIVSLNPSGKISISINYEVPVFGAMIPDGTSVPLPVGLKVRHPFLGAVPSERLNFMPIKNEILSPKKSKKRKRESLDEDGNGETPQNFADVSVHLSKKHKKEKIEESNFEEDALPGIPGSNEANEILREEAISAKKTKKHKKRDSEITAAGVDSSALPGEDDHLISSPSVDVLRKKIKKEKIGHLGSGDTMVDASMMSSPKHAKKKKKRDSEILSEEKLGSKLPAEVSMIGDASTDTSGVISTKNEDHEEINNRILSATYGGESDVVNEIGFSSHKIKKDKSKKRQTIESRGSETVVPDVEIEILQEGGEYLKKKRKKDKRRESEVLSSESDLQRSRVEVCVIPDTPEKSKKIKEEQRLKGEADFSLVESSFAEETPKKVKKKKKRDSEIGESTGDSGVMSDVVLIEGKSFQTPEVKIKKALKRDIDESILEVSNEGDGDATVKKSKKKHYLNKTGMEDVYVDGQDPLIGIGKEEMEAVKTEDEIDILLESGEHLKKKKKKDKKRESGVVTLDMDKFLKTEVDLSVEIPEESPRKKKKKIKEELDSSMSLEKTAEPLLVEQQLSLGDSESTKKAKRKKKRESEHGNGVGLIDLSENVELGEVTGEVTEVKKSKKQKWYLDPEPSYFEQIPETSKKMKKVPKEEVLDAHLSGESSSANSFLYSGSKKLKKRHTMDVGDTSALIAERNRMNVLPEVITEGKSHHKKRQSLMTPVSGSHIQSPKKEKIKREHLE
ncbi:tubulin glycylase 3C-like isoform X2 [Ischnura elegans]|uniref:tubulin glycylase 3C-like isoform X2 n=1 Tax=Ischnura elegans TaxID=197161 RepID=UPI001ED8BBF5|nr:tubulin glycylase 3C-like isoform X2 [Ischnura elegans]